LDHSFEGAIKIVCFAGTHNENLYPKVACCRLNVLRLVIGIRIATRPTFTGSSPLVKTIGIVAVAAFAASAAGVRMQTIKATRRASSVAIDGSRS
jgi:hypothetical protein